MITAEKQSAEISTEEKKATQSAVDSVNALIASKKPKGEEANEGQGFNGEY